MKTSSSLIKKVTFENESTKDVVLHWKKNVPYVSRNIIIHYDPHFTLVFIFRQNCFCFKLDYSACVLPVCVNERACLHHLNVNVDNGSIRNQLLHEMHF